MGFLQTLIGGLIGGGLIGFIEFLIRRRDEKADKNSEILKAIKQLDEKVESLERKTEEREALNARTQILRFDDELRMKKKHSIEYFRAILQATDVYERYCADHPNFENNLTVEAVENIKATYHKCKEENSFI